MLAGRTSLGRAFMRLQARRVDRSNVERLTSCAHNRTRACRPWPPAPTPGKRARLRYSRRWRVDYRVTRCRIRHAAPIVRDDSPQRERVDGSRRGSLARALSGSSLRRTSSRRQRFSTSSNRSREWHRDRVYAVWRPKFLPAAFNNARGGERSTAGDEVAGRA